MIFPSARIEEVAMALEEVSKSEQAIRSPGLAMITAAPGSDKVSTFLPWPLEELARLYKRGSKI